jgi:putative heme iron utilization protein
MVYPVSVLTCEPSRDLTEMASKTQVTRAAMTKSLPQFIQKDQHFDAWKSLDNLGIAFRMIKAITANELLRLGNKGP